MPPRNKLPSLADVEKELIKREGLHEFLKLAWPILEPSTPFIDNWHVKAIAEHVEAVYKGEIPRLIINIPPRMLKSLTASVFAPAWAWTKYPGLRMIFASYSGGLSMADSVKTRRILESPWFQERWGDVFQLSDDQNTKNNFENNKGGARVASSPGGTVTGKGADIITCDDLLDKARSESQALRTTASNFFWETLPSRFNDRANGRMIVIQQRLHPQDQTGEIIQRMKDGRAADWEKLILPMEYVPTTYVTCLGFKDPRTEEGQSLHPERFSPETIQGLKNDLGSYAYAGQYQQTPVPREGGMVKEIWFKNRFNTDLTYDGINSRPGLISVVESADCASKPKQRNDPTVWGIWGVFPDHVELFNVRRERVEFPKGMQIFKERAGYWDQDDELIEDKDAGQQYIQQLNDDKDFKIRITPISTDGLDKGTRMSAETSSIERGEVWLPESAPWLSDYLTEMCTFTGKDDGGHDVQCFVAGTKIATERGDIPIEELFMGDRVITPFGLSKVLSWSVSSPKKVIQQYGLIGTPDHPIIGINGKCSLDTISQSSLQFLTWDTQRRYTVLRQLLLKELPSDSWAVRDTIISVNQTRMPDEKAQKAFTWLSGNRLIEKLRPKDLMFTIKMVIHLTIARKIWNVYQEARIENCPDTITKQKNTWRIWREFVHWLQAGTAVLKEELGTAKWPKDGGPGDGMFVSVEKNLGVREKTHNIVQENVSGHIETAQNIMPSVVYNLKTSHGVYYANGILVSNCDMTSQFLKWWRKNFKKKKMTGPSGVSEPSGHKIE